MKKAILLGVQQSIDIDILEKVKYFTLEVFLK